MKYLFCLLLILGAAPSIFAQEATTDSIESNPTWYCHLAKAPSFPGGESALQKHLKANLVYPTDALNKKIEGKVVTSFLIAKDGTVGNVMVNRPLYPSCDEEAVRVVNSLPSFNPGIDLEGEPTEVWFMATVVFQLPKTSEKEQNTQEK